MKKFALVVGFALVFSSVSALASQVQVIDCSSPDSFDKTIISLKEDGKSGTLFLSSGAESGEDSGVMQLKEVTQAEASEVRTYVANNSIAEFTALIPSSVVGKRNDRFEITVLLSREDGFKAEVKVLCWSRIHKI